MNPIARLAKRRKKPRGTPKLEFTPLPDTAETNAIHVEDEHWRQLAACRGHGSKMFPASYKDITYLKGAREFCSNCPVREQCLEYALQFPHQDLQGVWAGLTPRQIGAEQRKRGIRPVRPTLAQSWADGK